VVQSTHKISGDAAAGFAAYLTSSSGRGDYYSEGGQCQSGPGRWHGSVRSLGVLGLAPGAAVDRESLVALMRGVSPVDGEPLRAVGGGGSRVAGIDLTFSAPKSVSALWAMSGAYRRAQIEAAHRAAVASALGRSEREVALVRRRVDGGLRWEHARGLVAAEFVHTASRLTRDQERGGVPDPQLHSHLVVLAAERVDGRFAAVDSRELFRSARVNGAWYRAELAWRLGELGLEVQGRTGRDGRYFELAGVPVELSARWSARTADIDAAARRFRSRYGRDPRAGELGALTVATRGTKTLAAQVDVDAAWRAVGEEYALSSDRAATLFSDRPRHELRPLDAELLARVTRDRSMVEGRVLEAHALELAAGAARPQAMAGVIAGLERSGELVRLQGGMWTTRQLRELEQRTLATARERAGDGSQAVTRELVGESAAVAGRQLGGELSVEQRRALEVLTGRGGVAVLVGEAGTGKGVVISAAREAWQRDGKRVVATAVAGATAKRLGADAQIKQALSTDALLTRHASGELVLDGRTVVVMDEAAMADTRRLGALTDTTARCGTKLVLVGDSAQLASIGAGGMFEQIAREAPSARLSEVHRAREPWERRAWTQVRDGHAEHALGEYRSRGRLHISDTRQHAAEEMVQEWDQARREHPQERVLMLTDASNTELDHINRLAQERRAQAGELGRHQAPLPGRPYSLRAGDRVILTGQLRPAGQERVENGTPGEVLAVAPRGGAVTMRTGEPQPREVQFHTSEFSDVRLGYAQHVYKAQGATVDRALVLTGGWQTDRHSAYVALSRARERTDIYVSREDLGEQGLDPGAITRLGERMAHSHAQQPSITRDEVQTSSTASATADRTQAVQAPELEQERFGLAQSTSPAERGDDVHESEVGRTLREQQEREQDQSLQHGLGLE